MNFGSFAIFTISFLIYRAYLVVATASTTGLWSASLVAPLAYLLWAATLLLVTVGAKRLLIGTYKPGVHPLWGPYFMRWWIVHRLESTCELVLNHLAGTPLIHWYLKAMGVSVADNVQISTALITGGDLISIGEGTTIGEVSG